MAKNRETELEILSDNTSLGTMPMEISRHLKRAPSQKMQEQPEVMSLEEMQEQPEAAPSEEMQEQPEVVPSEAMTEPLEDISSEGRQSKQSGGSMFEGIYDQLPDISVRSVDRFIVLCVIVLVAVILIGVLKANHVF